MALDLFEHNAKAYRAAAAMLARYSKAAVVHPTGTGKSYIAFKLIEDHPDAVFLWLSPSEYIFKTQLESLQKQEPNFPLENVRFYTYAKLLFCTEEQLAEVAALHPAYIIMDEFHRAGRTQRSTVHWGERVQKLLALCPDAKLLGLTATNIRYLDNNRDMAEELFDGRIASEMTLGEAIVRGILPAPEVCDHGVPLPKRTWQNIRPGWTVCAAPVCRTSTKNIWMPLRRALEQADGLDKVFAQHITQTWWKIYRVLLRQKSTWTRWCPMCRSGLQGLIKTSRSTRPMPATRRPAKNLRPSRRTRATT